MSSPGGASASAHVDFLQAIATAEAAGPPGSAVSAGKVAGVLGVPSDEAISVGLELIDAGLVEGKSLRGDGAVIALNGLRLTARGRRLVQQRRSEEFLWALEEASAGDPVAAVSAGALGRTLGWESTDALRVSDTLADDGLIESVELGSDLVMLTRAGRARLDDLATQPTEDDMGRTSINRTGIARMMKDIQQEFDKHPIRVPIEGHVAEARAHTTIYNGPVIHGDANGAQLAWGNDSVTQTSQQQIAPGFEALAKALVETLKQLPDAGLDPRDLEDAEASAQEALRALTAAEPDEGLVRRAVSSLKGYLAPLAAGLVEGGQAGVEEWAKTAVQHLDLPF